MKYRPNKSKKNKLLNKCVVTGLLITIFLNNITQVIRK